MNRDLKSYPFRRYAVWEMVRAAAKVRTATLLVGEADFRVGVADEEGGFIIFAGSDAYRLAQYLDKKARLVRPGPQRAYVETVARNIRAAAADCAARRRDLVNQSAESAA